MLVAFWPRREKNLKLHHEVSLPAVFQSEKRRTDAAFYACQIKILNLAGLLLGSISD
jgi:hypothetical protein